MRPHDSSEIASVLRSQRAADLVLRAEVERTGTENASTRIRLGFSDLRALGTSAWARVLM